MDFLRLSYKYLDLDKTLSISWNQCIHNSAMLVFFLVNECSIFHFDIETNTSSVGLGKIFPGHIPDSQLPWVHWSMTGNSQWWSNWEEEAGDDVETV